MRKLLFHQAGQYIALALRALEVVADRADTGVVMRLLASEIMGTLGQVAAWIAGILVDQPGLRRCQRDLHAAEVVDDLVERRVIDQHKAVDIHAEIGFDGGDGQLPAPRCAVLLIPQRVGGVQLIAAMVGDGHIQVAHEAGQLQFFVAGVDRNHHHAVAAAHIVRLVIIHAEQQDVGDGIVVVQPTQQVGIAQCLVCGRRVFIAAGDRAGTAGRGE